MIVRSVFVCSRCFNVNGLYVLCLTAESYHSRMWGIYKHTKEILLHNKRLEEQVSLMSENERMLHTTINKMADDWQCVLNQTIMNTSGGNNSNDGDASSSGGGGVGGLHARDRFARMMRSSSLRSDGIVDDPFSTTAGAPTTATQSQTQTQSNDNSNVISSNSNSMPMGRAVSISGVIPPVGSVCHDKTSSNLRAFL